MTSTGQQPATNSAKIHILLTVFGIPLLFWNLTRLSNNRDQLIFSVVVTLLAVFGVLDTLKNRLYIKATSGGSIFPLLWSGACVVYSLLAGWNYLYKWEIVRGHYSGDIFRPVFWNYWAPIYGQIEFTSLTKVILLLIVSIFFLLAIKSCYKTENSLNKTGAILILLVFNAIFIVAFAYTQDGPRLFGNIYEFREFGLNSDLGKFSGLVEVWKNWTATMGELGIRNQHYPPGNLFILKIEELTGVHGILKTIVIAATLLCIPLLFTAGRYLKLPDTAVVAGGALFATSSGATSYPTIAVTPLIMFLALAAFTGMLKALQSDGKPAALLSGIVLAIYSLFSFTVFITGLFIFLFLLLGTSVKAFPVSRSLTAAILCGLAFAGVLYLVYLLTGFNIVACLGQAIDNNRNLMTHNSMDSFLRYFLRSSGNILAYMTYSGVCIFVLFVLSFVTGANVSPTYTLFRNTTLLTLLIAGGSGLFFLETERIWLFFTPPIALIAGYCLSSWKHPEKSLNVPVMIIIANLFTTSVQELVFKNYL